MFMSRSGDKGICNLRSLKVNSWPHVPVSTGSKWKLNALFNFKVCHIGLLISGGCFFFFLIVIMVSCHISFLCSLKYSLKKSVLPMRFWPTQKRRNFTTAMENRVCGKVVGVAQGWTTSSPTFLVVDSLDLWVDTGVDPGMEAEGEERTWFTRSSTSQTVWIESLFTYCSCTCEDHGIAKSLNSRSCHVSATNLVEHTLH